jgi:hypothetical protein
MRVFATGFSLPKSPIISKRSLPDKQKRDGGRLPSLIFSPFNIPINTIGYKEKRVKPVVVRLDKAASTAKIRCGSR